MMPFTSFHSWSFPWQRSMLSDVDHSGGLL
jgi:hypothetical protein